MTLPKVYQNKNIGNINNDQEYYYSLNKSPKQNNTNNKINIKEKVNKLFESSKFIYKIKTIVITKDGEKETTIIGKTNQDLITIDNNLIPISDIIDIYEK